MTASSVDVKTPITKADAKNFLQLLGTLGAGYMSPEQIRAAIYKIRERTDKPFGVNLLLTKEIQIEEEKINLAKGLL
ncbi:nitronate monooxygenase, partial [Bacillus sp. D-CC]